MKTHTTTKETVTEAPEALTTDDAVLKPKGGRGKVEWLRNQAIVTLYETDHKLYNTNTLGKLFSRDRKTINGILARYAPSKQHTQM